MPLAIRTLGPFSRLLDSITRVTPQIAKVAMAPPYNATDFLRYGASVDLEEFGSIMNYRAGLTLFTYGRRSDFSGTTGAADADTLLQKASTFGIPPGKTYGLDLEDPPSGTPFEALIEYANGYASRIVTVKSMRDVNKAGLYVGSGLLLTSKQLTDLLVTRYMRSVSRIIDATGAVAEPDRGWDLYQLRPPNVSIPGTGTMWDVSAANQDYRGDGWTVVYATPSTTTFSLPIPESAVRDTTPPPPPDEGSGGPPTDPSPAT